MILDQTSWLCSVWNFFSATTYVYSPLITHTYVLAINGFVAVANDLLLVSINSRHHLNLQHEALTCKYKDASYYSSTPASHALTLLVFPHQTTHSS